MNVNHSLCIGVAKVRLVRWTVMDLVQRSKVKLVIVYKFSDTCQLTVHTFYSARNKILFPYTLCMDD